MARQAGGIARIESRPPHGTSVVLLLKSVEPSVEHTAREVDDGLPELREVRTVLVVDDDPDVRQFLSDSLETLGFRVILTEDGEEGLAALEASKPDVVLLDFAMPGMTGAELADRIRARHPDLPIVFASGYSESAAIAAAAGEQAIVLRKPFRVEDLDAALRAAVGFG
jgi:CheY-like chemotaxis protein